MFPHHYESIENISKKLKEDDTVLALIIAGSIAHGFAISASDVDIMILIPEEEYSRRQKTGDVLYRETESCTYDGGYIDGKYITETYIKHVIEGGGEPERFAFKDTYTAFSRIQGVDALIASAASYPLKYKQVRMRWFYARFLEWEWYYNEGIRHNNPYLINTAVCNMVLYGSRAILAHNELLYPFHKWLLKVLEGAPDKPEGFMKHTETLLAGGSPEARGAYVSAVKGFRDWGIGDAEWPDYLASGVELGCSESVL